MRVVEVVCLLFVGSVLLSVTPAIPAAENVFVEMSVPVENDHWFMVQMKVLDDADYAGVALFTPLPQEETQAFASATYLLDEEGEVLESQAGSLMFTDESQGTHVGTPVGEVLDENEGGGIVQGIGFNQELEPGKEYKLVYLAGSDSSMQGSIHLSGLNIEILDSGSGDALFSLSRDFTGGVSTIVSQETPLGWFHSRVILDTSVEMDVDGSLFGFFEGTSASGNLEMSVAGPAGSADGQNLYGFSGADAGDYTFRIDRHIDSADTFEDPHSLCGKLGDCTTPSVVLLAADVQGEQ